MASSNTPPLSIPTTQRPIDNQDGIYSFCVIAIFGISIRCLSTFAASTVTTSSLDGGGLHATSANYSMDSSVGDIGGISSGGNISTLPGSVGQLTEIVSISVTSTPWHRQRRRDQPAQRYRLLR